MTLKEKFGINYSRKRIQRIMRKFNIVCQIRKPNPYKRIAKATKEHTVVPNLLNRKFKQDILGKVLLTDITYLPYSNSNMVYLSIIKDASTKHGIIYKSCSSLEELQLIIDDYIDYYNNERCQWNLKKLTPVKYRNQLLAS